MEHQKYKPSTTLKHKYNNCQDIVFEQAYMWTTNIDIASRIKFMFNSAGYASADLLKNFTESSRRARWAKMQLSYGDQRFHVGTGVGMHTTLATARQDPMLTYLEVWPYNIRSITSRSWISDFFVIFFSTFLDRWVRFFLVCPELSVVWISVVLLWFYHK